MFNLQDVRHDFVLIIYLREPILYKPAGFFWASSPLESNS